MPVPELVVIGGSTGGTASIRTVLQNLPADTPPVLVVQHIGRGCVGGFIDSLAKATSRRVAAAADGGRAERGVIYVAPEDRHLKVERRLGRCILHLSGAEPVAGLRPSVDVLFESAATAYGALAVGILLSGMGGDGAQGLAALRRAGARTFAQDQSSSVVWGMPGEAARLRAAESLLPPAAIGRIVHGLLRPAGSTAARGGVS